MLTQLGLPIANWTRLKSAYLIGFKDSFVPTKQGLIKWRLLVLTVISSKRIIFIFLLFVSCLWANAMIIWKCHALAMLDAKSLLDIQTWMQPYDGAKWKSLFLLCKCPSRGCKCECGCMWCKCLFLECLVQKSLSNIQTWTHPYNGASENFLWCKCLLGRCERKFLYKWCKCLKY